MFTCTAELDSHYDVLANTFLCFSLLSWEDGAYAASGTVCPVCHFGDFWTT